MTIRERAVPRYNDPPRKSLREVKSMWIKRVASLAF
jgi:hypothetical protein